MELLVLYRQPGMLDDSQTDKLSEALCEGVASALSDADLGIAPGWPDQIEVQVVDGSARDRNVPEIGVTILLKETPGRLRGDQRIIEAVKKVVSPFLPEGPKPNRASIRLFFGESAFNWV